METSNLVSVTHTLQTVAIAALIFALVLCIPQINLKTQLARLPSYTYDNSEKRKTYLSHAKKLYSDGYKQFKDKVYRMATNDGVDSVVVPPKFLPELRRLPDSVLSFPKAIEDLMHTKYTKLETDAPILAHTIKADLTPALFRLNKMICSEVEEAMQDEMPTCEDWTPVSIYMALVNVVAKVSGRVFVGPELCRNEDYLDSGKFYTLDLMEAQRAVSQMKPWLRPFLADRLSQVKALRKREEVAHRFLDPIVQARREAMNDPNWERPDDFLQWILNRSDNYGVNTTDHIATLQLGIIFAAIHTTTLTATNILYNLAVTPEYLQPLREEIRTAIADNGSITTRALQQMEKLDSYMKETMRFYPAGFTSFTRKVLKGITLSNGQHIPPGASIEVPSYAVYHDEANYPDGDSFDGFRFAKIRESGTATDHARNQFVTTNEQNLAFGYGRHACPGRFFAANEIKMILARIILDYDFKNADGVTERYPNTEIARGSNVDASKKLLFKKVVI